MKRKNNSQALTVGICIALGTAIGAALGDVAIGLGCGGIIGIILMLIVGKYKLPKDKE